MSQASVSEDVREDGTITGVSGPVVTADGLEARMNDVVYVGEEGLMGEVIEIEGDETTIQVYEETSGVEPGEPVANTGNPLTVDLGPGMLDSIYDGVQRPLDVLEGIMGSFLDRGVDAPGIDLEREWEFTPTVEVGDEVGSGDVVGTVPETESIEHKVLVPPDSAGGTVEEVESGAFTVEETIAVLDSGEELTMHQEWPVRQARPTDDKHSPTIPLVTGQRIQDGLFPIAKGGTAAIPGPFGSGKCVTPETPVLLGDGETVRIDELFHRFADDPDVEGEVIAEADAEILTFDPSSGRIRPTQVSHVYRGSTDRLVRITTASGRELEVTPAHKLFRMRGDLEVEETPAGALAEGETLVMPRQLRLAGERVTIDPYAAVPRARAMDGSILDPINEAIDAGDETKVDIADAIGVAEHTMSNFTNGYNKPTLVFIADICDHLDIERPDVREVKPGTNGTPVAIPEAMTPALAELLGLLISDGHLTEKSIRFHNNDATLRERFSALIGEVFGLETREAVHNTVDTSVANSRVVSDLLHDLGVPRERKARNATVPDAIKRGDDDVVTAFLRGHLLGDGSFSGGTVELGTSSEGLASDLTYLLTRIGVLYRIRQRDGGAYRISVTGAEELTALHEALAASDFAHDKLDRIEGYAETTVGNTNIDTVPVDLDTMTAIADQARYTDFEAAGLEITNSTGLGQSPSRDAMQALCDVVADGGSALGERLADTASMMDDVFFDPITDIEVIEEAQPVYDVTVPDTENFVGGFTPSVLHNTVTQQSLAKFADADIVVYIGCGERGNEMTEVIEDFPELPDPQTGNPLMARTCLIANTSNMPVAARESCVYTGITIAEYYRDMGYDVALMADSTSRWAEAMREISSRLEEMPGEEGYPAYLAARLSQFYERAGLFTLLNGDEGSISVVGAVSPPGGDFSEPVTQNTLRIVKTFWALDADLAERRHFPAINWDESYSLYRGQLDPWFEDNVAEDWPELRQWAIDVLDEESELQEIVQLVGKDALPEDQQLTLEVSRFIREAWLQQNALHDVDRYCPPEKTYDILQAIKAYNDEAFDALDAGVPVEEIRGAQTPPQLNRIGTTEEYEPFVEELVDDMTEELRGMY